MNKYYCIFDLETTGLNKDKDQIIQYAAIKADKETNSIIDSLNLYIQPVGDYKIGLGSYFKHGLTPKDLADKPHFAEVADKIIEFMDGCDIVGYNSKSFDIPFLCIELEKVGKSFDFLKNDVYDIFLEEKRRNGNTLDETFKRYYHKTMEENGYDAHNALSDVKATYDIMLMQMSTNEIKPENMFGTDNVISMQIFKGKLMPCFNIGQYKTIPVEYVAKYDQQYIKWCVSDHCKFFKSTKEFLNKYLK